MARPKDTSPAAQAIRLEHLRATLPEDRLAAALDASEAVRALAEAGVRARHPTYSDREVRDEVARLIARSQVPAERRS